MIGLFPILQSHVFDMVSSGHEFKLWIPSKNQFIVGDNEEASPSTEPLGNLRPQVIYDALLLQAVDLQNELAVLEASEHEVIDHRTQKATLRPDYSLNIIKQNGHQWYLSRKVVLTELICGHTSNSYMTSTDLSSQTFTTTNIGKSMGSVSQRTYRSGDRGRNTRSSFT
jgi:hypothetical protein